MTRMPRHLGAICALGLAGIILAACTGGREGPKPEVQIRGSDPNQALQNTGANTLNNAIIQGADQDGIVTYDGYQSALARDGDTVETVAGRVGLSAAQLGAYNGLPATHRLQAGDELVLPPRPGGYGGGSQQSVVPTSEETRVASAATSPNPSTVRIETTTLDGGVPVNTDGSLATSGTAEAVSPPPPPTAPRENGAQRENSL